MRYEFGYDNSNSNDDDDNTTKQDVMTMVKVTTLI